MKKFAVILPGQSSQYIGMGKALYENYEIARKIYDEASRCLGYDVYEFIKSGDMPELMKAPKLQPAILVTSYCFYMVCNEVFGMEPEYLAGHSLGEITALACAGSLQFQDAVRIAEMRGKFMQEVSDELGEGAMAAISEMGLEEIKELCEAYQKKNTPIYLANLNSYDQYVVSGLKKDIIPFIENVKEKGGKAITLRVNLPFHSPYMKSAAEKFAQGLKEFQFNTSSRKIISNVTGKPYSEDTDIAAMLVEQIISPVLWIDSMKYLADNDVELILEMGPGRILSKMTEKISDQYLVNAIDNPKDENACLDTLRSHKLFNKNYMIERFMGVAVSTKNNNFDEESYQNGVVKPYNKIRSISDELEARGKKATDEDVEVCKKLLLEILQCKQVKDEEINVRLKELQKETMLTF